MNRVANFYPGPTALPISVLDRISNELYDFQGLGMSVMELSHRSPQIQIIIDDCVARIKRLMHLDDSFSVVLLQG